MRKLVKRLLACCLVFALALTMLCGVGAISASAASTGTLTVESQKIDVAKVTTAVLPITLATDHSVGFAMATYKVVVPEALQDKLTGISVASDSEVNPAILSYKDTTGEKVTVNEGSTAAFVAPAIDDGEFQVALNATSVLANGPKSITVNLTFNLTAYKPGTTLTKAYDEFAVSVKDVVACDNGLSGASYDIQYIEVADADGSVIANYLRLASVSAVFESDYKLFFVVNKSIVDNLGEENVKVRITKGGSTFDVYVNEAKETTSSGYKFILPGVPAKEVADPISATVMYNDYEGTSTDYNLVSYAMARINNKNATAAEKKSMAAFLEYAAAGQKRFNYNNTPETLADKQVPAELKNATSVELASDANGNDKTKPVRFSTASVSYEAQVLLNIKLAGLTAQTYNGYKIRFTSKNGADLGTFNIGSDFRAVCDTVAIRQMVTPIDMTIVQPNGEDVLTMTYSFRSYAYSKREDADGEISRTMMAFAKAFAIFKGDSVVI